MDDRQERPDDGWTGRYVAPVGRVSRTTPLAPWVALATIALAVAVLKPWGSASGPASSEGADRSPSPSHPLSNPAAADPALSDPDLLSVCHNTDAWLLATSETSRGQTLKILRVLSPSPSVAPNDPAIARVVFGSEQVLELGWCAPVVGPGRSPGVESVQGWVLDKGGARPLTIRAERPDGGSPFGMLYRPPLGASGDRAHGGQTRAGSPAPPSWASGVYVFTLRDTAGIARSFAVDLEILPPRGAAIPRAPSSPAPRP